MIKDKNVQRMFRTTDEGTKKSNIVTLTLSLMLKLADSVPSVGSMEDRWNKVVVQVVDEDLTTRTWVPNPRGHAFQS